MADNRGTEASSLEHRLQEQPYEFDFFQAVRRLQCAQPGKPLVGSSQRPQDDPVRFRQVPSMAFASSALAEYRPAQAGRAGEMFVNFLGLLGPNGPMPLHLTEYVHSRELAHDSTAARFLDIFNHRMISLLYRAWAVNEQTVNFERGDDDRFAFYIASMFGLGMPAFRRRDRVDDVAKLFFSGHLAGQTKHPEGLCAILETYFRIVTGVEEFVGQWVDLPGEYCCRLGESPETATLGHTTIVGHRVWQCQHKFRIRLGPMSLADYQRMLPGGDSLGRLVDWVRNYLGDELDWDVQLILKKQEVPRTKLAQLGQLGWSTWIGSTPAEKDADDLILKPFAA
ncbi:MAG: type VI secretion system baseplate subunit TssG [Planctomycetes bacterium]|nr:type VI secretion system baseplate subunit TssG [Planctomycetota bacterium]